MHRKTKGCAIILLIPIYFLTHRTLKRSDLYAAIKRLIDIRLKTTLRCSKICSITFNFVWNYYNLIFMENTVFSCKNCEQKISDNYKFCPNCGQQTVEKLTVGLLFYNTISNYFSFDARFFRSIIPLLVKPGYLASKFVEGKRLLYLHPAKMYLFITIIFFFLFSFIQRDHINGVNHALEKNTKQDIENAIANIDLQKTNSEHSFIPNQPALDFGYNLKLVDSLIAIKAPDDAIYKAMGKDSDGWLTDRVYEQNLKLYKSKQGGNILEIFYRKIPIAMFFLLPIFALILNLFHIRKGAYAHHLVFSFYLFSFIFTILSVMLGINFIWNTTPSWINKLLVLSTFVYFFIGLKQFYKQGIIKSLFKASITVFLFTVIVIPITFVILAIYSFLFF